LIPEIKITTLCENSVPFPGRGLLGEHGLAMLLEIKGKRILFDTGAGLTLLHNAKALNVDLSRLDAVVLSHGHYDHTGGLKDLLHVSGPINIFAHPDIFGEKYHVTEGKEPRKIAIPWSQKELESFGAKFNFNREPREIYEGVILTGEIPRVESLEEEKSRELCCKNPDGSFLEDPLNDDQAIIVESSMGSIVMLGCAHSGILNTLHHVNKITRGKKIFACLGGTHLIDASAERLHYTIKQLMDFQIEKMSPCHCSGFKAAFALFQAFRERFYPHTEGSVFQLV